MNITIWQSQVSVSWKVVIEAKYGEVSDFVDGRAAVHATRFLDGPYDYIDEDGEVVIDDVVGYHGPEFSEGLVQVSQQKDGDFGFIDRSGEVVISAHRFRRHSVATSARG